MGIFDYFTKETEAKEKQKPTKPVNFSSKKPTEGQVGGDQNASVRVFKPTSYEDVISIIDFLLLSKPAVVNLSAVKDDTVQRVIDILSGACYALHGSISEVANNIYLISPDGVAM